ncbi:unnamed protein product [Schistosoma turkestanicum]|nr:unnamed protein product [Schistosoma turkestanicum]
MKILTVITILAVAYVVQVLSNKFPSSYKSYLNESSDGFIERRITIVDILIYDAVLQNRTSGQMITWNPLYQDSSSTPYQELFYPFCNLIIQLVRNVTTPGSDGGRCKHVQFSKINIHNEYDSVIIIGVKAKLLLRFVYPDERQLNMNSIFNKLKVSYRHNNKLSFLKIIQMTTQVTIDTLIEKQEIKGELLRTTTSRNYHDPMTSWHSKEELETMTDTTTSQQSTSKLVPTTIFGEFSNENVKPTGQNQTNSYQRILRKFFGHLLIQQP